MAEHPDLFLAALLRGELADWPDDWSESDAEALWDRIRFHGIAYFVAEKERHATGWPAELAVRIRREAQTQQFCEETHRAMLQGVYAGLGKVGVEALVMKGSALAYSLYEQPAARRRGDTDLLVRERDLGPVRSVLAERGFARRNDPHGLTFQETWLYDTGIGMTHALDLHWQPSEYPLVQQALSTDAYFAAAVALPRLAENARMPSLVHSFVQCAINHAWHGRHGFFVDGESLTGSGRLIGAMDSAKMVSSFSPQDWSELTAFACQYGLAGLCLDALNLAREKLGAEVPEHALRDLREAPQDTGIVRRLREKDLIRGFLSDLRAIPSAGGKLRFASRHAFPPGAHLRLKYPACAAWPIPLLHLRRIGEAAMRLRKVRSD